MPIPKLENAENYAAKGKARLKELSDNLDGILLQTAKVAYKAAFFPVKDFAVSMAEDYYNRFLPESIKNLIRKAKKLMAEVDGYIDDIAQVSVGGMAFVNAFYCGLINGIISIVQTAVSILAFAIGHFQLWELEKFSFEQLNAIQPQMEFLEDVIDTLLENSKKLFEGFKKILKTLPKDLYALAKSIGEEIKGFSIYFWAYFFGGVLLEVLLDLLLAYLTGGSSVYADVVGKISRVSARLAKKGVKLAKQVAQNVARDAAALLRFLKREFEELVEAIKNGNLRSYIIKKIEELFGIKIKPFEIDLLEDWDNLPVSGRGRRLGQKLTKSNVLNLKKWLNLRGVVLELHPSKGSYDISNFFIRRNIPAKMPEEAAALFITDGTKMTIVLRKGATIYEFFHEFMHFRHAKKIGLRKYLSLGGKNTIGELEKEQWVYDKIIEYREIITKKELKHANWYINDRVRFKFGEEPLDFDFEIDKIPEVRKEVDINKILNLK